MHEEWKELSTAYIYIYKKGNKKKIPNYRRILLWSTTYKILSSILLSRLSPYAEEFIGLDGRIILGWIFGKWDMGVWIGSSWLRIETDGGHL